MIGSIVVVALMTVLSILLISGKALNMVPGYRSLPDKVKKTLDPKKVGRKLGIPMLIVDIVMVIFFLIVFLSDSEKLQGYAVYGMMFLVVVSLAIIDMVNITGNDKKYKGKQEKYYEQSKNEICAKSDRQNACRQSSYGALRLSDCKA